MLVVSTRFGGFFLLSFLNRGDGMYFSFKKDKFIA